MYNEMLDSGITTLNISIPQSNIEYNPLTNLMNSDERYIITSLDNIEDQEELENYMQTNSIRYKVVSGRYKGKMEVSILFNARNWDKVYNCNIKNENNKLVNPFDAQETILYLWPYYMGVKKFDLKVRPVSFYHFTNTSNKNKYIYECIDAGYIRAVNRQELEDNDYTYTDGHYFTVFDAHGQIYRSK